MLLSLEEYIKIPELMRLEIIQSDKLTKELTKNKLFKK